MISKQKLMANKADSSAHGKGNPWGHPTCRFVGKTAGRIDLRLILPKFHLATLIILCGCPAFTIKTFFTCIALFGQAAKNSVAEDQNLILIRMS